MTKTEKNLNSYIDATIRGFSRTFDVAKEDGWNFSQFMGDVNLDADMCLGAMIFAHIYENKIDGDTFNKMRNRLNDAKWEVIRKY